MGPRAYIEDYVNHHRYLGAMEIFIFFDEPVAADIRAWLDGRGVRHTICDERYWKRVAGTRPGDILSRQAANFRHAFGQAKADWLLHDDLDERLMAPGDIGSLLARLDDDVFSVTAPSVEAVYEAEPTAETAFRTPWFRVQQLDGANADIVRAMYGEFTPLSRNGIFGHIAGKSFIRTTYAAKHFDCHGAEPVDPSLKAKVHIPGLNLLHFDALTFADWKEKWIPRITQNVTWIVQEQRRLQFERITAAYRSGSEAALHEIYCATCLIAPEMLDRARGAGMIERHELPVVYEEGAAAALPQPFRLGQRLAGIWKPVRSRPI
jgi:hypothetical protein